jgi:hypothetical protein
MRMVSGFVVAGVLLMASSARADSSKPVALIEGQLGAGAPLGFAGIGAGVSPTDWLDLVFGIGQGESALQVGGMARLHFGALTAAAGYSRGGYVEHGILGEELRWGVVQWANAELGYQTESGGRGAFSRAAIGWAHAVDSADCIQLGGSDCADGDAPSDYPYITASVGYRF